MRGVCVVYGSNSIVSIRCGFVEVQQIERMEYEPIGVGYRTVPAGSDVQFGGVDVFGRV